MRLLIDLKLTVGRANGTITKSNVRLTDLKVIYCWVCQWLDGRSDKAKVESSSLSPTTSLLSTDSDMLMSLSY